MNSMPEAGSDGTGLGRLDGLIRDDVYEEIHEENMVADDLAQRMAAMTVQGYVARCGEGEDLLSDLLEMLGLPEEFEIPTQEEKASIRLHLPKSITMDSRSPDSLLAPERRPY